MEYKHVSLKLEYDFAEGDLAHAWLSTPVYDSSITRALYAYERGGSAGFKGFLLWDVLRERAIWKDGPWTSSPVEYVEVDWRRDNQSVVLAGPAQFSPPSFPHELYEVSRDGDIRRLTALSESRTPGEPYYLRIPRWSPDGHKIAFLEIREIAERPHTGDLYVLDLVRNEIVDYCVDNVDAFEGPLWSPDGAQIAIIQNSNNLEILDLAHQQIFSLGKASRLIGWSAVATKPK